MLQSSLSLGNARKLSRVLFVGGASRRLSIACNRRNPSFGSVSTRSFTTPTASTPPGPPPGSPPKNVPLGGNDPGSGSGARILGIATTGMLMYFGYQLYSGRVDKKPSLEQEQSTKPDANTAAVGTEDVVDVQVEVIKEESSAARGGDVTTQEGGNVTIEAVEAVEVVEVLDVSTDSSQHHQTAPEKSQAQMQISAPDDNDDDGKDTVSTYKKVAYVGIGALLVLGGYFALGGSGGKTDYSGLPVNRGDDS